jgi:hypothetical protein
MLTHMAPPPRTDRDKQAFVDDLHTGGFDGRVLVCDDLDFVEF